MRSDVMHVVCFMTTQQLWRRNACTWRFSRAVQACRYTKTLRRRQDTTTNMRKLSSLYSLEAQCCLHGHVRGLSGAMGDTHPKPLLLANTQKAQEANREQHAFQWHHNDYQPQPQ